VIEIGTKRTIAVPKTPTITVRTTSALATPIKVERHWRVTPTARTIVNASTNSTIEARNAGSAAIARLKASSLLYCNICYILDV